MQENIALKADAQKAKVDGEKLDCFSIVKYATLLLNALDDVDQFTEDEKVAIKSANYNLYCLQKDKVQAYFHTMI